MRIRLKPLDWMNYISLYGNEDIVEMHVDKCDKIIHNVVSVDEKVKGHQQNVFLTTNKHKNYNFSKFMYHRSTGTISTNMRLLFCIDHLLLIIRFWFNLVYEGSVFSGVFLSSFLHLFTFFYIFFYQRKQNSLVIKFSLYFQHFPALVKK